VDVGFTIDFSNPVAAFGFSATDIGDFGGRLQLTLTDGSTQTVAVPHTVLGPGGSVLYFGIIDRDNPFTRVVFTNSNPVLDQFGFDDMTIADAQQVIPAAVPEPGSVAIWAALGLLGAVYGRRRGRTAGQRPSADPQPEMR
jgi:hypothetical protein